MAELITGQQVKMLNAVCGCLADQISWHGARLGKDDWRWVLSGIAAGWRMLPGWDGKGFIILPTSSRTLTKEQAQDAITMGIQLGDDPESQGLKSKPVQWSQAVLNGLGFTSTDMQQ